MSGSILAYILNVRVNHSFPTNVEAQLWAFSNWNFDCSTKKLHWPILLHLASTRSTWGFVAMKTGPDNTILWLLKLVTKTQNVTSLMGKESKLVWEVESRCSQNHLKPSLPEKHWDKVGLLLATCVGAQTLGLLLGGISCSFSAPSAQGQGSGCVCIYMHLAAVQSMQASWSFAWKWAGYHCSQSKTLKNIKHGSKQFCCFNMWMKVRLACAILNQLVSQMLTYGNLRGGKTADKLALQLSLYFPLQHFFIQTYTHKKNAQVV